jgi:hypothetical protein
MCAIFYREEISGGNIWRKRREKEERWPKRANVRSKSANLNFNAQIRFLILKLLFSNSHFPQITF